MASLATATLATMLAAPSPAAAQQKTPGNDPECPIVDGVATCTGDVSGGIIAGLGSPVFDTLNVGNLSGPIAPAGVLGIGLYKVDGDLTVNIADDVIIETYDDPNIEGFGQGILAVVDNGFDLTINTGATIRSDGNGSPTAGIEAVVYDGPGNLDVTNRGNITAFSDFPSASAIAVFSDQSTGSIRVNNSGDLSASSEGTGERDRATAGIFAFHVLGGNDIDVVNSGRIDISVTTSDIDSNGFAAGIVSYAYGNPTNTRISNSGSISAMGPFASGIATFTQNLSPSAPSTVSITNDGTIRTTNNEGGYGILAQSDGSTVDMNVFNRATIQMDAPDGAVTGIFSRSVALNGTSRVENYAAMTGSGFNLRGIGISAFGAPAGGTYDFTVINQADFDFDAGATIGITAFATAEDNVTAAITNSGNFNFTSGIGTLSSGIRATFDTVDNSANGADGLSTLTIDNSGNIFMGTGNALLASADQMTITNSGILGTTGAGSDAVILNGIDKASTLAFSTTADITASGAGARGIAIVNAGKSTIDIGADATVSASGSAIFADGLGSGVASQLTITNAGAIRSDIGPAIRVAGGPGFITHAGILSGDDGTAIAFDATGDFDDQLVLMPGFSIAGMVDFGSGSDGDELGLFGAVDTQDIFDVGSIGTQYLNLNRLRKADFGAWTLEGSSDAAIAGGIFNGLLINNANLPNFDFTMRRGRMEGTGTVGPVLQRDGTIAPGNGIGTFTINGDFDLNAGELEIEVNDQGQNDLLVVNGAVKLADDGDALLTILETGTFAGSNPFNYLIIDNDGTDPINGTFGSVTNSYAFLTPTLNYAGGDGNDLALTLTPNAVGGDGCSPPAADDVVATCSGTVTTAYGSADADNVTLTVRSDARLQPAATAITLGRGAYVETESGSQIIPTGAGSDGISFGDRSTLVAGGRITTSGAGSAAVRLNGTDLSDSGISEITRVVTVEKARLADYAMNVISDYIKSGGNDVAPGSSLPRDPSSQNRPDGSAFYNRFTVGDRALIESDGGQAAIISQPNLYIEFGRDVTNGLGALLSASSGAAGILGNYATALLAHGATLASSSNGAPLVGVAADDNHSAYVGLVDVIAETEGDNSIAFDFGSALNSVGAFQSGASADGVGTSITTFGDNSHAIRFGPGESSTFTATIMATAMATSGNGARGVAIDGGANSSVSVAWGDSSATTGGMDSDAIHIGVGGSSDVLLLLQNSTVSTTGGGSDAVDIPQVAKSSLGAAVIIDSTVSTDGDNARGFVFAEQGGEVSSRTAFVAESSFSTLGDGSTAMLFGAFGNSSSNTTQVLDTTITTAGTNSRGIDHALAGDGSVNDVTLDNVNIATTGATNSGALVMEGTVDNNSAFTISLTDIDFSTTGTDSDAVFIGGGGFNNGVFSASMANAALATLGAGSRGLVIDQFIASDDSTTVGDLSNVTITTAGANAHGIWLGASADGAMLGSTTTFNGANLDIATQGDGARGFYLAGLSGEVEDSEFNFSLADSSIVTAGADAVGIKLFGAAGDIVNPSGNPFGFVLDNVMIQTGGDGSAGLVFGDYIDNAIFSADLFDLSIFTAGSNARGLYIPAVGNSSAADATVDNLVVRTTGASNSGAVFIGGIGSASALSMELRNIDLSTLGSDSDALFIEGMAGNSSVMAIDLLDVTLATTEANSRGFVVENFLPDVDSTSVASLTNLSVTTEGANAHGVWIGASSSGDIDASTATFRAEGLDLTTQGDGARGLYLGDVAGDVSDTSFITIQISDSDISTIGDDAVALEAFGVGGTLSQSEITLLSDSIDITTTGARSHGFVVGALPEVAMTDDNETTLAVNFGSIAVSGADADAIRIGAGWGSPDALAARGAGDPFRLAVLEVSDVVSATGANGNGLVTDSLINVFQVSENGALTATDYAVLAQGNGGIESFENLGTITGDILLGDEDSTFTSSGTITGNIDLAGGTNSLLIEASGLLNSLDLLSVGMANVMTIQGTLSPGGSGAIQSTNLTGNLNLGADSTFIVDVNSNGSDKVIVAGTVTLGGGTLDVVETGTFAGDNPFEYIIIDNDAADAVNGTFGTIQNDYAFLAPTVSYTGGTGNDVLLTLTPNNEVVDGCTIQGRTMICTGDQSDGVYVDDSDDVDALIVRDLTTDIIGSASAIEFERDTGPISITADDTVTMENTRGIIAHITDDNDVSEADIVVDAQVDTITSYDAPVIQAINEGSGDITLRFSGAMTLINANRIDPLILAKGVGNNIVDFVGGSLEQIDSTGPSTPDDASAAILVGGVGAPFNRVTSAGDITTHSSDYSGIYAATYETGGAVINQTGGTIRTRGDGAAGILVEHIGGFIPNSQLGHIADITISGSILTEGGASSAASGGRDIYASGILLSVVEANPGAILNGGTNPTATIEITETGRIFTQNSSAITTIQEGSVGTDTLVPLPVDVTLQIAGEVARPNASDVAIDLWDGDDTVTIAATGSVTGQVLMGNDDDMVTNAGSINGAVDLGAGNDTIVLLPTYSVTGLIDGSAGNDSFILDGAAGTSGQIALLQSNTARATNFEDIRKRGAGMWTITGDDVPAGLPLPTGTIEAGTLRVYANIPGLDLVVQPGARLSGIASVGSVTLTGGILSPGAGESSAEPDGSAQAIAAAPAADAPSAVEAAASVAAVAAAPVAADTAAQTTAPAATGIAGQGRGDMIVDNAPQRVEFAEQQPHAGSLEMVENQPQVTAPLFAANAPQPAAPVTPQAGLSPVGTLTINGDLTMDANSFYVVDVRDDGGSDQVIVNGLVTLGGATLSIGEIGNFTGDDPFNYLIIDNDAADAVNGVFGTITNQL
ncbi:MAG: hypothetical protein COA41_20145, partial [Sphingopyxis sp.]